MALSDTGTAIGAVTRLLKKYLGDSITGVQVPIGRPQDAARDYTSSSPRTLNLFLYEIQFDQGLRQLELDEGQPAPLWLILKYLLTAFDGNATDGHGSDTAEAHSLLGQGIQALHELSLSSINKADVALQDNPEELKLKFEDATSDLLSKLMQGSEEQYRCSVCFEVRPVMIATSQPPPAYSLLVGIDYTVDSGKEIGDAGIQIPVLPSIGPSIFAVDPAKIEPGTTLTIRGENLNLSDLSVRLGPSELPIVAQASDFLQCQINDDEDVNHGTVIAAGSHALTVCQSLTTGTVRSSNLLEVKLLPVITAVEVALGTEADIFRTIDMTGKLLGTDRDDVFVALYRDTRAVKLYDQVFEDLAPPHSDPNLMRRRLKIHNDEAVPVGQYQIILKVNGQQAKNSPLIDLGVP
jgi:hypothetical protein